MQFICILKTYKGKPIYVPRDFGYHIKETAFYFMESRTIISITFSFFWFWEGVSVEEPKDLRSSFHSLRRAKLVLNIGGQELVHIFLRPGTLWERSNIVDFIPKWSSMYLPPLWHEPKIEDYVGFVSPTSRGVDWSYLVYSTLQHSTVESRDFQSSLLIKKEKKAVKEKEKKGRRQAMGIFPWGSLSKHVSMSYLPDDRPV